MVNSKQSTKEVDHFLKSEFIHSLQIRYYVTRHLLLKRHLALHDSRIKAYHLSLFSLPFYHFVLHIQPIWNEYCNA